jgi:ABC-type dipeptide/oligopeptide/nickel transport system ATPase subunit
MQVELAHCNNIERGQIAITEGVLNIKYAINGTGKSTIAKAIAYAVEEKNGATKKLVNLIPFKHRAAATATPSITGIDDIAATKIFNEDYINSFVFQQDDLLKGSFEIFIKTQDYDNGLQKIEELIQDFKDSISTDPEVDILLADFEEISSSFGKPVKTGIHAAGNIAKAFKDGNKIANIPAGLEAYTPYIRHESGYKWIRWQQEGASYLPFGSDCPYCTSDIKTKRETIEKVAQAYDPKSIETLNKIVSTFDRLNKYFSAATKDKISEFVKNTEKYTDEQVAFLNEVKTQIERLGGKFKQNRAIGFSSLRDVGKVLDELGSYKIDLGLYHHLQSEETAAKVRIINESIQALIEKAGALQGAIIQQRTTIERLVKVYSAHINDFLANAGYSYRVELREGADSKHKLLLTHLEFPEQSVSNVRDHLSFGERNAIALVLFMFDAVKSDPKLIVLDDPISSFDKNKKYAIIEMLFRGAQSLRGKTVLLLTHDLDPVVDMVVHHADRFIKPTVAFLENKDGILSEKIVTRAQVKTFIDINQENIAQPIPLLNRLVYLRRLLEVTHQKGDAFDILSNVFHKRRTPKKFDGGELRDMTEEEIKAGCEAVLGKIPDFSYAAALGLVTDKQQMKQLYHASTSNYEKLHLYRILFDHEEDKVKSNVILKFINEAFHIENNYIYQLNPREYQLVPHFVIKECDKYVATIQ